MNVVAVGVGIPEDHLARSMRRSFTKFLKACTCTHCKEPLVKPTTLQCGHCFCFDCAFDYTGQHGTCPECNLPSTMAGSLKTNPQMTQIMDTLNNIKATLVNATPFWWRSEQDEEVTADMLEGIKVKEQGEEGVGGGDEEDKEDEEDDDCWGDENKESDEEVDADQTMQYSDPSGPDEGSETDSMITFGQVKNPAGSTSTSTSKGERDLQPLLTTPPAQQSPPVKKVRRCNRRHTNSFCNDRRLTFRPLSLFLVAAQEDQVLRQVQGVRRRQ